MAIKKIVRMGNPVLRQVATPFTHDEILAQDTKDLIQDLYDTMKNEGGIGIAAPQIGVSKQLTLIELNEEDDRYNQKIDSEYFIIFNPKIEFLTNEIQGFWEGCLSVPSLRGYVERPNQIKVSYLNEKAQQKEIELNGFLATVFQHEIDHLFGKLYVDRIQDTSKLSYLEEYEQFHL